MRRSVWAGFGVLLALLAFPQGSTCQIPEASVASNLRNVQDQSATIINLVQQSHEITSNLDVNSRVYLLQRQIQLVLYRKSELAREWIDELFALSFEQRKGSPLVVTQQMAITALSQIDPDAALNLLNRMSTNDANQKSAMISAKTTAATGIFSALVARDGVNGEVSARLRSPTGKSKSGRVSTRPQWLGNPDVFRDPFQWEDSPTRILLPGNRWLIASMEKAFG